MTIRRVTRYDSPGEIGAPRRTDEGFFLSSGRLAQPGIMPYKQPDGSIILELVEKEVLNDAESMATLEQKAFTIEHPEDDVTPDNWHELAHGDVTRPRYDDDADMLIVDLAGKTRAILDEIDKPNGKRELSPGYTVKVDDTPGEHPVFGKYDTRQIPGTRRYNHVALTDGARGGHELQLRKDSAIEVKPVEHENEDKPTPPVTDEQPKDDAEGEDKLDAFMKEMRDGYKSLSDRIGALEKGKDDASDEEPAEQGADSEKPNDDGEDKPKQDSFMTRFAERTDLIDVASRFGVDHKADATNEAIRLAVVEHVAPEVDRKDAAQVKAAFALIKGGKLGGVIDDEFARAFSPGSESRTDSNDTTDEIDYDNAFYSNLQ